MKLRLDERFYASLEGRRMGNEDQADRCVGAAYCNSVSGGDFRFCKTKPGFSRAAE